MAMLATAALVIASAPPALADGGVDGRMTGGGWTWSTQGEKVTHGFTLQCSLDEGPNNLQINWDGNSFHLTDLSFLKCKDREEFDPSPPDAEADTVIGHGTGRLNNEDGYKIVFSFRDEGEPGVRDFMHVIIRDPWDNLVLEAKGRLHGGNHQAHFDNP